MSDCAPCCSKISEKHHAVILDLSYGLTDTREKPQPIGKPLTQAQAWQRHYKATPASAATRCSATLKDVDCAASLARHQMSKAERVEDDWVELRGRLVTTGRAKLFDLVVAQDPDSESRRLLREGYTVGVEVRDKKTGEVTHREMTEKEEQSRIDKAAAWRMKRPSELTDAQKEPITEVSWDPSRGILKYKLETLAAIKSLSEIDGKRTVTINESDARAKWKALLAGISERLPIELAAAGAKGYASALEDVVAALGPEAAQVVEGLKGGGLRGSEVAEGVVGVVG